MKELPDLTDEDLRITYNLANEPGLGATAYRTRQMIAEILRYRAAPSVRLTACEPGALRALLREPVMDEYPMARAAIERLIAAHGENQ